MLERTSGLNKLMSTVGRMSMELESKFLVGSRFEPRWRPLPAKLSSIGGYSHETLPYLESKFLDTL